MLVNDSSVSSSASSRRLASVTFPTLDSEALPDGSKVVYEGWSFRGLRSDEAASEAESVSETQTSVYSEVEPEPHGEAEAEVEPEPHAEAEAEVEPEPHGEGEPSASKQSSFLWLLCAY